MSKKIKIVTATEHTKETFIEQSTLYKWYINSSERSDIELIVNYENTLGLPLVYNKYITEQYKECIVVFVHDDVEILSSNIIQLLNDSPWDITGLAGGKDYSIKESCMWHLCCPRDKLSGAVSHPTYTQNGNQFIKNADEQAVSVYGPWPRRCSVIDGLFMAVNIEKALASNFKFDEDFDFHFYDISSCIIANNCKLKIGTYPIHVLHQGLGDSAYSNSWKTAHQKFTQKWQLNK